MTDPIDPWNPTIDPELTFGETGPPAAGLTIVGPSRGMILPTGCPPLAPEQLVSKEAVVSVTPEMTPDASPPPNPDLAPGGEMVVVTGPIELGYAESWKS